MAVLLGGPYFLSSAAAQAAMWRALARVVGLVARRAEEHARRVQQLAERENDHQQRHQRQVHVEPGSAGSGWMSKRIRPRKKAFTATMSVCTDELHPRPVTADAEQQRQHQVIGRRRDVADAVDQETARPQPGQAGHHGEAGVHAEGLDEGDPVPHRLGE